MSNVVKNNHLIDQIQKYDENVRDADKDLVSKDTQLLNVLSGKNARDEYMNDEEAKNIMKQ